MIDEFQIFWLMGTQGLWWQVSWDQIEIACGTKLYHIAVARAWYMIFIDTMPSAVSWTQLSYLCLSLFVTYGWTNRWKLKKIASQLNLTSFFPYKMKWDCDGSLVTGIEMKRIICYIVWTGWYQGDISWSLYEILKNKVLKQKQWSS